MSSTLQEFSTLNLDLSLIEVERDGKYYDHLWFTKNLEKFQKEEINNFIQDALKENPHKTIPDLLITYLESGDRLESD